MKNKPSPFSNMTIFGRSVGLLLVAVVLVGSIALLVLNYVHQRTTTPGTLASTTKPTPIPPTPTPTPIPSGSIGKTLYTTLANTGGFYGIGWSSDSKRMASSTSNGVQIWDATNGNNLITVQMPDTYEIPGGIDWSHNSQMLAVAAGKHVLLIDGQSGKVIRSYGGNTTAIIQPVSSGVSYLGSQFPNNGGHAGYIATAWSPDGELMASVISYFTSAAVQIWNTETATTAFTLTLDNSYNVGTVAWSPDGQYIATTAWNTQMTDPNLPNSEIIVWKVSTHQIVFQHKDNLISSSAVWQPGSHNLTFTITDGTLEIWNSDTGKPIKQYARTWTGALGWSPDGRYLAYADLRRTIVVIRDMITDKQVYVYKDHIHLIKEIAWSPDGNYIVSSEGDAMGEMMIAKVWVAK